MPAGIELVAMAIAACLLRIDPAVAEPACAGGKWSRARLVRAHRAIRRILAWHLAFF